MTVRGQIGLGLALVSASTAVATPRIQEGPRLTFACRAESVARALDEIGKAANVHLEATPALQREIVVISVKDVPLSDLLSHLATATSGEFKPMEEGGYRLVANPAARTAEERKEAADRLAALQEFLRPKIARIVKPKAPATPNDESITNRLQYRIVSHADLKTIAGLRSNGRIVFSTNPTHMQLPFTGSIQEEILAIVANHNRMVKMQGTSGDSDDTQDIPEALRKLYENADKPVGAIAKALLVVSDQKSMGGNGPTAELKLYDAKGTVVLTSSVPIDPDAKAADSAPTTGAKTPVTYSPETKEFLEAYHAVDANGSPDKISNEIRPLLYRPDRFDPLGFVVTDQIFALAKKIGKPLVACVPDEAIPPISSLKEKRSSTVEDFQKEIAENRALTAVGDPQWTVLMPARPAFSRGNRPDRVALAKLLQATLKTGVPTLDDVADYSLTSPAPTENGIGEVYVLTLVSGAGMQGLMDVVSWETMRLYGSFDTPTRQSIRNGARIPFSRLTPFAKAQVEEMVYSAASALDVDDGKPQNDFQMSAMLREMLEDGEGLDFRAEPTELLPNGLPADGFVTVAAAKEPIATRIGEDGQISPGPLGVMDADMLAAFKLFETPEMSALTEGADSGVPKLDRLRLGSRDVLNFTFQVAPKVAVHHTLADNHMATGGAIFSIKDLPADFQKIVAVRLEKLKKSPMGAIGSMMGGMGGQVKP